MKKIMHSLLALTLVVATCTISNAQVRKVTAEVTEAFRKKYPSATNVEWKDRLTGYTAKFDDGSIHYEARFSNKAEWQSTQSKIATADLPAVVNDGFQKSKYATDWKINEIYKITVPGDKTQYELHIQKGELQKKVLLFSSEGRLLKDGLSL